MRKRYTQEAMFRLTGTESTTRRPMLSRSVCRLNTTVSMESAPTRRYTKTCAHTAAGSACGLWAADARRASSCTDRLLLPESIAPPGGLSVIGRVPADIHNDHAIAAGEVHALATRLLREEVRETAEARTPERALVLTRKT